VGDLVSDLLLLVEGCFFAYAKFRVGLKPIEPGRFAYNLIFNSITC